MTIMALTLKAPEGHTWADVRDDLLPRADRLFAQLHDGRDLLEQPPPSLARGPTDQRRGDVGEPAPAVLSVTRPRDDRCARNTSTRSPRSATGSWRSSRPSPTASSSERSSV